MSTPHHNSKLRLVPALSGVVLVAGLVWAAFADIDQISRAPGQVIPAGRTQIVQSADGGVIDKIFIKEGDLVKRGQLLVTLDSVKLVAAVAPKLTAVAPVKPVPVITTLVPPASGPLETLSAVTVGAAI